MTKDEPKMEKTRSVKLNNKGVSLVELLVAISIFSIVVVVIYQGFVLAAKTNSKAKIQYKATSLAQNVMEGLKAESLNEILHQFSLSADGKYYLCLKDVEMEDTLFDVLITIDGSQYKNGSDKGQAYNDWITVQIPDMDTAYDALVANSKEYDEEGFLAVSNSINNCYDPTLAYRRITVTIEDMPVLNPEYPVAARVTAKYEYFYSNNTTPYYAAEDVVFDTTENPECSLRNIFLFFQPSYGHKADQIIVDNSDNRETELFLIKQQTSDDMVQLSVDEDLYNLEIEVKETPADITNEAEAALKLRTNLGVNLGNGSDISFRECYKYQTPTMAFVDKTIVKKKLDYNDLTNEQSKESFFDVTIEVHRAGTGGVAADITAFQEQWGEQVAVITGSICN